MEKTEAGAALGCAGEFFSGVRIDEVAGDGVFEAGGALAGILSDESAFDFSRKEGEGDEFVDALVALRAADFGKEMGFWNEEGVCEVVAVVYDATTGGAFYVLQVLSGKLGGGLVFGLEVAIAGPVAGPVIDAQDKLLLEVF